MKEIATILDISLYFIAMLACFGIARFIYKDKKGDYLAGGSAETAIMILVALLPIVNVVLSAIIILTHLISKSRDEKKKN